MELAEYGIGSWDAEAWGNHRALVEVSAEHGGAVRVFIPWRRHDKNPEKKGIFILAAATQKIVYNLFVPVLNQEIGEIIFQPDAGIGIYEIYYMVFAGKTRAPYPKIHYLPEVETAEASWLNRVTTGWEALPQAKLLQIQACNELHSFYPMEVCATEAETIAFHKKYDGEDFLLFGECRENSIRMRGHLPFLWVQRGAFQPLCLEAKRGEYLVFQVGVYAHQCALEDIQIEFSDLVQGDSTADTGKGEEKISAKHFTCFNTGGIDCYGKPFTQKVDLLQGNVQALWCGIQIEDTISAGIYKTKLRVYASGFSAPILPLEVTVCPEYIVANGDDEPQRLSRLRWLNSTLGSEATIPRPFSPVLREKNRLKILGREVHLGPTGLPEQIISYFTPELTRIGQAPTAMLSGPCRFEVRQGGRALDWRSSPLGFDSQDSGQAARDSDQTAQVSWQQRSRAGQLNWDLNANIEFDGCLNFTCQLTAENTLALDDIVLHVPLQKELVKYRLGLGYEGQASKEEILWNWDVTHKGQDSLWLGKENAGLQISLRDEKYRRPLNTNFYYLQPLISPSWDNCGKGGILLQKNKQGHFDLICHSGPQVIDANQPLFFIFRFLITPFKVFDTYKQWNNRFFHAFSPPIKAKAEGANVINIHHAQPINPYINYPFLRPKAMKAYAEEAQRLGMKMRIYYTVRELTNHAPEIFALRSLGAEIFAHGQGGGHSWLQEHFEDGYIGAWHVFEYGCVAVINAGTSRWHNFYVEGIDWLARNMGIDGIYIDDLAFDRRIMQRVRRVLDQNRPDAIIDLHSANQFNERDGFVNSINLYMEHLPYLDRLWFGEYFRYEKGPDYWMTEVAGIPFGVGGEMLQDGGNLWRGLLYGMTCRYPDPKSDPRPLWKLWEEFGISKSEMLGYWSPSCPVKTSHTGVLATCYKREKTALLAIASWEEEPCLVQLTLLWEYWGLSEEQALEDYCLRAPEMEGVQKERVYQLCDRIPIEPANGIVLILEKKQNPEYSS